MERSKIRDKLEDKLQRAKRHRSEFLRQKRRQCDSISLCCDMMSKMLVQQVGQKRLTNVILDKGELQVVGKERKSQFSSQFRNIATMVMHKTINPEIQRPYTISMVERLMHKVHFAVDPHSNSKKQALDVICKMQKHFPIKRSPIRLRLTVPVQNFTSLLEKLREWDASVVSKDESGTQMTTVCEMEPGLFRECNFLVRNMQGRLEILAVSFHTEGDTSMDHYDEHDDMALQTNKPSLPVETLTNSVVELSMKMQKQEIGTGKTNDTKQEGEGKWIKCSTYNTFVGEAKQYREHLKSGWHKHNLKHGISRDDCKQEENGLSNEGKMQTVQSSDTVSEKNKHLFSQLP